MGLNYAHKYTTMQSIAQVQNVQKINAVSTGKVANEKSMMVWRPHGNKMFETFSFLPPLSDADLTKQVQYLLNNGWTPCLEFEDPAHAYTRPRLVWFGLLRQRQLLRQQILGHVEVADVRLQQRRRSHPRSQGCVKAFPNCYVRCAGFDNIKQVQCAGFLCYRPKLDPMEGGTRAVGDRQI